MTTGDDARAAAASAELRRWKTIALASAFVAVAMVGGAAGWILRGAQGPAPQATSFSGGGAVVSLDCESAIGGITVDNAQVIVVDAGGKELASSRLMAKGFINNQCRRAFVIDKIPGGRGIYTLQVGRWKQTFTEAALRGNLAEMPIS